VPALVAVEDRGELVRGPAGLLRCPGVGLVPVPSTIVPGRDEQRGEGVVGQFRVAARDRQCGHFVVVPGDLLRDGRTGREACRHDRGRSDDLGRAKREVQVLRVLPGLAENLLQDLAARDDVLSAQRVEQVEGVVAIKGAGSPRSHPGTVPWPHGVRHRAVGRPWHSRVKDSRAARRAGLSRIRTTMTLITRYGWRRYPRTAQLPGDLAAQSPP
jgi:hypothetical protein